MSLEKCDGTERLWSFFMFPSSVISVFCPLTLNLKSEKICMWVMQSDFDNMNALSDMHVMSWCLMYETCMDVGKFAIMKFNHLEMNIFRMKIGSSFNADARHWLKSASFLPYFDVLLHKKIFIYSRHIIYHPFICTHTLPLFNNSARSFKSLQATPERRRWRQSFFVYAQEK